MLWEVQGEAFGRWTAPTESFSTICHCKRAHYLTPFPPRKKAQILVAFCRAPDDRPHLESDLGSSRSRAEPTAMQLVHPLRGLGAARADDSTTSLRPAITKRKALGDGSVGRVRLDEPRRAHLPRRPIESL